MASPEKIRVLPSERIRKGRVSAITRNRPNPLLVQNVEPLGMEVVPAEQLETLRIDERYQRKENTHSVNEIVATIEAGGVVPDPIAIAVRPDGTRWIVDGQQRWWAHWLTQTPIRCNVLRITTSDPEDILQAERALFTAFNTYIRPTAGTRIRAWPGIAGKYLNWLHDSEDSPLRGELNFGTGSGRYRAALMTHGLFTVLTGVVQSRRIEDTLRLLETAISVDMDVAKKRMVMYALTVRQVFAERTSVHYLGALALALACYNRWVLNGEPPNAPDPKSLGKLQRLNWEGLLPSRRLELVPVLVGEIDKRWTPVEG